MPDLQSMRNRRADKNLLAQLHRDLEQALAAADLRLWANHALAGEPLDFSVGTSYVSEVTVVAERATERLLTEHGRGIAAELLKMYLAQYARLCEDAVFGDDYDGDIDTLGGAA